MATPAGWYPDPSKANRYRWWDGAAWTDYTQEAPNQGFAPPGLGTPAGGPTSAATPPPPPPPPPGSGFPPPPPPGFGAPFQHASSGHQHASFTSQRKASYGRRIVAVLLDGIFCAWPLVIMFILAAIAVANSDQGAYSDNADVTGGWAVLFTISLIGGIGATAVLAIWNQLFRQGRTGQTFGKRKMRLALLSANTGETIGTGRVLGRTLLASVMGNITLGVFVLLDYLWPLWDSRGQRIVDKMLSTVVVPCDDPSQIRRRNR